ncbi:hypothetical protein ABE504_22115 [Paenibacillus oryzisoli]
MAFFIFSADVDVIERCGGLRFEAMTATDPEIALYEARGGGT